MNTINWLELVKSWTARLDSSTPAAKFRAFATMLLDAPYVWGAENPQGTDCSGCVCFPLWMMGYNIRVGADILHKQLFPTKPVNDQDLSRVIAVFYITRVMYDDRHGRIVPPGTAIHVTPVVGNNVVVQASDRIKLTTALAVRQYFEGINCFADWREIDWAKADQMSNSGQYAWGVDPILSLIRSP